MAPNRTATPAKHSTRSTNKTNGHSTDSEDATSFQIKADPEASSEEPDEEELYDDTEDEDRETAGFISKESLPIPGKAGRTLAELNLALDSPYLNLDPDYQRDVVWTSNRMSGLIDSLIENYYIPPIIFNVKVQKGEDGKLHNYRTCVDGKQRLSSIHAFINGKIPCHDKKGRSWFFAEKKNDEGRPVRSSHRILPKTVKEEFLRKELTCYEFSDITQEQEEDLFQRVQKGVQLTPAEKLRATRGPWQSFAIMYEHDFEAVATISGNLRSSAFRHILTCFAQILESQYPSTPEGRPVLRGQVSSLEKFVQNGSALNETTKSHLRRVFTIFNNLLEDDPQTFQDNGYTRAKKFAPIELVGVCVLISQHGTGGRSLPMLHGDIRDLRGFLREKHKDLRMNNSVWKDIWEFIDDLEGRRGAADGSTVLKKPKAKGRQTRTSQRIAAADGPSYVEIPEPPAGKEVEAVVPGPTVDGRAVNGDDDDDDDDHVDGEAMLNRFIQAPKTAAEPPNKSPPRPAAAPVATMSSKTQNQPLPTAATVSKTSSLTRREETRPADTPITKASYASRADKNQNLPRPADTSVTNAGSATHDQETTPLIKPERDAPLPTRPIPQVATPASNIKRRAPLDLGSGARALAGKKARLA